MNRHGLQKNFRMLWWLRNFAIGGQALTIALVTCFLRVPLPLAPLWAILAFEVVVNIALLLRMRSATPLSDTLFFTQLLIDMAALTGLIYYSGGAANPFTSLFILQVLIAAVTLPARYTWCIAVLTVGLYTGLVFYNVELPHLQHTMGLGDLFNLHVQGMWVSFVLLALFVNAFLVRMNATIRQQAALLYDAERLAAVGTLAASAAHELGTPLSTIAVLAGDYAHHAQTPAEREHADTLKAQVARCKAILSRITISAGVTRAESGGLLPASVVLQQLATQWQQSNPQTVLHAALTLAENPQIIADHCVKQAIGNLLDNAADASPAAIWLEAGCSKRRLTIRIRDTGTGIQPEVAERLGMLGFSNKADGLGMGLFLAQAIINRLGGSVALRPAAEGGTVTWIEIPLSPLMP